MTPWHCAVCFVTHHERPTVETQRRCCLRFERLCATCAPTTKPLTTLCKCGRKTR